MAGVRSKIILILLLISFFPIATIQAETIEAKIPGGKKPPIKFNYIMRLDDGGSVVDMRLDSSNEICGDYFKNPKPLNPKKKNPTTDWIPVPSENEAFFWYKGISLPGKDCLNVLRVHVGQEKLAQSYLGEKEPQSDIDMAFKMMIFQAFKNIDLNN